MNSYNNYTTLLNPDFHHCRIIMSDHVQINNGRQKALEPICINRRFSTHKVRIFTPPNSKEVSRCVLVKIDRTRSFTNEGLPLGKRIDPWRTQIKINFFMVVLVSFVDINSTSSPCISPVIILICDRCCRRLAGRKLTGRRLRRNRSGSTSYSRRSGRCHYAHATRSGCRDCG